MNYILESLKTDSNISSARLMQWTGLLAVLGTWVLANLAGLVGAVVILVQSGAWSFEIKDLVTIVALVGGLIAGKTVQSFSEKG